MAEEEVTFQINQTILRDYVMYAGQLYGMNAEEWLPYSPVDVDEQVYVSLGERSFNAGDTEPLEDFIAELREMASKAPKRAEVIIKLSTGYAYEDERGDPEYELGYWRDPTKKERAEREETNCKIAARDARKAEEAAERERAEFERLKAKFEA